MGSRKTTQHAPQPELILHSARAPDVLDPQSYWAAASDEELCDIVVQTGSRDAMEAIVRRYSPLVCKIVARWLRSSFEREDAYQATFIILLQSIPRIRKRASLSSFVFGVAFRTSKRIRQTRLQESTRREAAELVDVAADVSDCALGPLEILANRLQLEKLDEELRLLPESLRSPIIQHYYAGRSVPQIADSMRLSVSAVEGRIKRGKQQLRTRLALRGVSVSAALSTVAIIPTEVTASDINNLVHFLFKWNPTDSTEPNTTDGLINSSSLQHLIQGEMTMKWSLLQSGMVWSGAVAAITLVGLAAIPLSLSAQGTAGRVMIAGAEPTAQPEAIALAVSSIQEAHSAAPESSDNPFSSGDSVSPVTGVPNQNAPVATKATVWQVQGPVPSWLDSELDKEELRIANEIRSKLGKTHVDVDFNSVPLNNVLARIADTIGIDIYIDERSLKDFGVSVDEPITLRFKNPMTARDTLSLIMHRLCLSYTIRNGFVVVAYQETQRDPLRTYDLSYVLPDNSTVHELMGVIRSSVHPEAWDSGGGMGTLGVFGSMLVVKADEETHQDLERLLRELARQNKNHIQPTPQDPAQSSGPVGSTEMGGRGGAAIGDMGGMF